MPTSIHEIPKEERPREKLLQQGPSALSTAELLAIFIRTGLPGKSAIELARDLLEERGLVGLYRCQPAQIAKTKGIGSAKAAQIIAALELGKRLAREEIRHQKLDEPSKVFDLLGAEMRVLQQESLRVVLLDTQHRLIQVQEITLGSLNESLAPPREILRAAVLHCAHAYILVHNHPSGSTSPSAADREITRKMARISGEIEIQLLDHVIIGGPEAKSTPYFSFREHGLL